MASVDWSPTTLCGTGNTNATACYVYNALGQRVQATYGGNSYHDIAEWLFDPSGAELSECEAGFGGGNGRCWYGSWVRLGGRSIAGYWPTNFTAFNHADNLGSTTMVTAQDGTVATDMRYYPFGQVWQSGGRGMWDIHFAGMQYPETNFNPWLMPTPNRKYYPNLGRWLTPDPAGQKAVTLTDSQTWNMYAYAGNNPTTRTDPSGLCWHWLWGGHCKEDPPPPPPPKAPKAPAVIRPGTPQNDLANAQAAARANPKFQPSGTPPHVTTYCNLATVCTVKQVGGPTDGLTSSNGDARLGNDAAQQMPNSSEWHEVSPAEAQNLANQGVPVVGIQENPGVHSDGTPKHGHEVTAVPELMPGLAQSLGEAPMVNNIGRTVGVMPASQAFPDTSLPVHYYAPNQ